MRIPSGPISEIAPKIENKINKDGISVSLEMIYGLKILSIVPTRTIDQMRRPTACNGMPVKNKKSIAGIETIAVPIVGTKDATAATTAQITAFGTPNTINPVQVSIP